MQHFFQPLDLTVNGSAKHFMKKKFVTWYAGEVKEKIKEGTPTEQIEGHFNFKRLKPIYANWMVEMYNFLTGEDGCVIILNGWKKAGIIGMVQKTDILPPKGPFA